MGAAAKVFISYKRDHAPTLAVVEKLREELVGAGLSCYIDEAIIAGDRWSDTLYRWLLECPAAVAVISDEASGSEWCRREWEILAARARTRPDFRLVPLRVSPEVRYPKVFDEGSFQRIDAGPDDTWIKALRTALAEVDAWTAGKADFLALHRGWLESRYSVLPAIGREPFTLANIYTETDAGSLTWGEVRGETSPEPQRSRGQSAAGGDRVVPRGLLDPFNPQNGGHQLLLEMVCKLLGDQNFREAVVIQGPAGAGKSAFCLRLAHELSAVGLTPLLVRFRDMRLVTFDGVGEMITDACRVGPDEETPPRPEGNLFDADTWHETCRFGDATICRTVLILDGWDEVSLSGSTGYKAQLSTWLPRIREFVLRRAGAPMRLVVTGRPSNEVRESGFLARETRILTMRPLTFKQFEAFTERVVAVTQWGLTASKVADLIEQYRHSQSMEVLNLPLLALLGLRTVASFEGDLRTPSWPRRRPSTRRWWTKPPPTRARLARSSRAPSTAVASRSGDSSARPPR